MVWSVDVMACRFCGIFDVLLWWKESVEQALHMVYVRKMENPLVMTISLCFDCQRKSHRRQFPSLEVIDYWTLNRHDLLGVLMMGSRCA